MNAAVTPHVMLNCCENGNIRGASTGNILFASSVECPQSQNCYIPIEVRPGI